MLRRKSNKVKGKKKTLIKTESLKGPYTGLLEPKELLQKRKRYPKSLKKYKTKRQNTNRLKKKQKSRHKNK